MQKGSIRTPVNGVQPTSTYLITQNKASRKHNIYKLMQWNKTNTYKGASNFQCIEVENMLPQGGAMDIRCKHYNPMT
jgi:hypothetical protein